MLGLELLRPRHRAIAVPYASVRSVDGEIVGLEFLSTAVRDHVRLPRLVADYGPAWNSLYHQTSSEDGPYVDMAPQSIVIGTAWSIVLIWGILKVCVNFVIDVREEPRLRGSAKQAA